MRLSRSPDGRRIAYWRDDGLWTIAPDGSAPTRLVAADAARGGAAGAVQWGPDGATLYSKWIDPQDNARIWAVPRTGGAPRLNRRRASGRSHSPTPRPHRPRAPPR